ncbi:MAG: hypothetical protein ABIS47_07595, partial [Acidimicrobiales bacterium]
ILVQVARFPARTFAALEGEAAAVDWSPWTGGNATFRVTAAKSRLFHTAAVAERLERAASQATHPAPRPAPVRAPGGVGAVPAVSRGVPALGRGAGPTPFVVRLDHDHVTISADAGGDPLHRRGWRLATAKAPIRPTVVAAALRTIGWAGTTPLVDPFCGAGTIAIEAASLAAGLAPGRLRPFAFQAWPAFAPGTWASVQGEVRAAAAARPAAVVLAADRDGGAVAATAANAARAGVTLDLRQQPLSSLEPPDGPPGWLVANPPWGDRTPAGRLGDLYEELGAVVRDRLSGWGVALLVADPRMAQATGLRLRHRWATPTGGTRVHLLTTAPER